MVNSLSFPTLSIGILGNMVNLECNRPFAWRLGKGPTREDVRSRFPVRTANVLYGNNNSVCSKGKHLI